MVRTVAWVVAAAALAWAVGPGHAQAPAVFVAHLWGREQVITVASRAFGVATFEVAEDGASIRYRLEVSRIVDVQMAHIHVAAPGQNGPVVVWL
ncbi:MAG: CHRD domain-containing protein [Armatimonadota bacterium]|nr:CHRD domain-containing protein [Armatimonadota bacterium]MDW8155725.1 CHRD domain-containing protein [Armatimonadota bacterium]